MIVVRFKAGLADFKDLGVESMRPSLSLARPRALEVATRSRNAK